jgi:hypothetical protein
MVPNFHAEKEAGRAKPQDQEQSTSQNGWGCQGPKRGEEKQYFVDLRALTNWHFIEKKQWQLKFGRYLMGGVDSNRGRGGEERSRNYGRRG